MYSYMKVLWITNILFPEAEKLLSGSGDLKSSGGWLIGSANALLQKYVKLFVATVSLKVKTLTKIEGTKVTYYVIPFGKGNIDINLEYCEYWKQIQSEIIPDVVHIHGTEFSQGYSYVKALGVENVVVSIQGLASACYPYFCYGLKRSDIIRNFTFRDLLGGSVLHGKNYLRRRSKAEIALIKEAKYFIGRTSWDRIRVQAINIDSVYYFCNETLRDEFYGGDCWRYDQCDKYSIFLSQAYSPIKGLHQVLKAMPYVLRYYPETHIRIAGKDITKVEGIKGFLTLSGYGRYIRGLIEKYNLHGKIHFTGALNACQMKNEYLKSNVFVCPSSIENSPNSLGEAQMLGVPCVASYVGGIPDMMQGNEDNLYRYEEIEMLAYNICQVFSKPEAQFDMRNIAFERHNPQRNAEVLYEIYMDVMNKSHR